MTARSPEPLSEEIEAKIEKLAATLGWNSKRHKSWRIPILRAFASRVREPLQTRESALREALEKLLPRYEHLCDVLVVRDSTWAIREQARAALAPSVQAVPPGEKG